MKFVPCLEQNPLELSSSTNKYLIPQTPKSNPPVDSVLKQLHD